MGYCRIKFQRTTYNSLKEIELLTLIGCVYWDIASSAPISLKHVLFFSSHLHKWKRTQSNYSLFRQSVSLYRVKIRKRIVYKMYVPVGNPLFPLLPNVLYLPHDLLNNDLTGLPKQLFIPLSIVLRICQKNNNNRNQNPTITSIVNWNTIYKLFSQISCALIAQIWL